MIGLLGGILLYAFPAWGLTDAVSYPTPSLKETAHSNVSSFSIPVPSTEAVASFPGAPVEPMVLGVVEGSGGLSLERLRRELNRYPDDDLLGRFVQVATERPPFLERCSKRGWRVFRQGGYFLVS